MLASSGERIPNREVFRKKKHFGQTNPRVSDIEAFRLAS